MQNKNGCKIVDTIDDYELIREVEKRLKNEDGMKCYSMEEVMDRFGITQEELDKMEDVEIG